MPTWKSARLRRLYGKPTDPIETAEEASASPEPAGQIRQPAEPAPAPPPKRIRREKTRPESEYELVHQIPVTATPPDYSLLVNPLSEKQAGVVAYAVHSSRNNWLSGSMFETFWTRKPRGKKASDNQPNLRDKMAKLHECAVTLGPHTFAVKLFTVKDDNVQIDEKKDRVVEEKLAAKAKERQAKEEANNPVKKEEAESNPEPNSSSIETNQASETTNEDRKQPGPSHSGDLGEPVTASLETDTRDGSENKKDASASANDQMPGTQSDKTGDEPDGPATTASKSSIATEEPESVSSPNPDSERQQSSAMEIDASQAEKSGKTSYMDGTPGSTAMDAKSTETAVEAKPENDFAPVEETKPHEETKGEEKAESEKEPKAEKESKAEEAAHIEKKGQAEIEVKTETNEKPEAPAPPRKAKGRGRQRKSKKPGKSEAEPAANSVNQPATAGAGAGEAEIGEKQRSFEKERQNLEVEKRRLEELERRLKGRTPDGASPATQSGGQHSDVNGADAPTNGPPGMESPLGMPSTPAPPIAGPTVAPSGPAFAPHPPHPGPVRAVPNEMVVSRLQQMAAQDPTLGELMRVVASQAASHEDIVKFQEIINRVKASIFVPPPPQPTRSKAKAKPKAALQQPSVQRAQPIYQPRANSKAIMLAIEYDENPSERHLLPKRSIIEYIPSKGQLLWSFLHVFTEYDEPATKGAPRQERKIYTPITATFHDIPPRVAQTMERCVRKPEVVAYYMKETMATAERAEPWYIWYQIEKNDEILREAIKKTQAPTMAPPPVPRKPMKPRKPRAVASQGNSQQSQQRPPGSPLIQTYPMIIGRRGQPMVQAPSHLQSQTQRRARNTSNRSALVPPSGLPLMAAPGPAAAQVATPGLSGWPAAGSSAPPANNTAIAIKGEVTEDGFEGNRSKSEELSAAAGVSDANANASEAKMEIDG